MNIYVCLVVYTRWGGYSYLAPLNYGSLLQNVVSFIGLFCKRALLFEGAY